MSTGIPSSSPILSSTKDSGCFFALTDQERCFDKTREEVAPRPFSSSSSVQVQLRLQYCLQPTSTGWIQSLLRLPVARPDWHRKRKFQAVLVAPRTGIDLVIDINRRRHQLQRRFESQFAKLDRDQLILSLWSKKYRRLQSLRKLLGHFRHFGFFSLERDVQDRPAFTVST